MLNHLVVELELRDGQFQSRMRSAQAQVSSLSSGFSSLSSSAKKAEVGLQHTLPHLRDISIVTSSLYSIISSVNETIGVFGKSLIRASADIERTTILLQGLSKSIDFKDKVADANKDLEFLFNTAKRSPFALKELSNAFVKMRVSGITDVERKLSSLTNAIASFGGGNEALHRSSVAIQQMSSKGVISMEELRQQIGESVPNAMQSMADGMGLTMASLTKNVQLGKVNSVGALNAMFKEMELSSEGASARMMESWDGLTSQIATNWQLLEKKVGDSGAFKGLKDELKKLNEFLQSDSAMKYAQMLGDGINDSLKSIKSMSDLFSENKDFITDAGKALLAYWAITKTMAGVTAIGALAGAGLGAVLPTINRSPTVVGIGEVGSYGRLGVPPVLASGWGAARGGFRDMFRTPTATVSTPAPMLGGFPSMVPPIISQVPIQMTAWTRTITIATGAFRVLGATVGFLTGPFGLLAVAIGAIAMNFEWFKSNADKANESLQGILDKQNELDKKGTVRVKGDAALQDYDSIKKAREDLKIKEDELAKVNSDLATKPDVNAWYVPQGTADIWSKRQAAYDKQKVDADTLARSIYEGQVQLMDRISQRKESEVQKELSEYKATLVTKHKQDAEAINKSIADSISANEKKDKYERASMESIDEEKRSRMLDLYLTEGKLLKKNLEERLAVNNEAINNAKTNTSPDGTPLRNLLVAQGEIDDFSTRVQAATEIVSKLKYKIQTLGDGDPSKAGLLKDLAKGNKDLETLTRVLDSVKKNFDELSASEPITSDTMGQFNKLLSVSRVISENLKTVNSEIDELSNGKMIGDGSIMNSVGQKESDAYRKKLSQFLESKFNELAGIEHTATGESAAKVLSKIKSEGVRSDNISEAKVGLRIATAGELVSQKESGGDINSYNMGTTGDSIVKASQTLSSSVMTLSEVMKRQALPAGMIDRIFAFGKWQITGPTMKDASKAMGLTGSEMMNETMQDKIASDFLFSSKKMKPFYDYITKDKGSSIDAQNSEAKVFRAIPVYGTNESYGGNKNGNRPLTDDASVQSSIAVTKAAYRELLSQGVDKNEAYAKAVIGSNITSVDNNVPIKDIETTLVTLGTAMDYLKQRESDIKLVKDKKYALSSDQIDALIAKQTKDGVPEKDRAVKMPDEYYKTLDEVAKREKLGQPTVELEKALALITDAEAVKKTTAGDLKTAEESKRIKDGQYASDIKYDEKRTDMLRENNAKRTQLDAEAAFDAEKLYQVDVENFRLAEEEKLKDSAGFYGEKLKLATDAAVEEYKRTKVIRAKIETAKEARQISLSSTIGEISRSGKDSKTKSIETLSANYQANRDEIMRTVAEGDDRAGKLANADAQYSEDLKQLTYDHRNAFEVMIDEERSFSDISGELAANFTNGMIDGLATMAVDGKASFSEMALSIMKDLEMMIVKMLLMKALQAAFGGTEVGTFFGLKDGGAAGGNVKKFADGGLMSAKQMSMSDMLSGGVKSAPHVALFAEAGVPEAFIPMHDRKSIPISLLRNADGSFSAKAMLPNGRSIPATIRESNFKAFAMGGTTSMDSINGSISSSVGGLPTNIVSNFANSLNDATIKIDGIVNSKMGMTGDSVKNISEQQLSQSNNVTISISVTGDGKETKSESKNKNGGGMSGDIWSKMADGVKEVVIKTLIEERRPGGLISQN